MWVIVHRVVVVVGPFFLSSKPQTQCRALHGQEENTRRANAVARWGVKNDREESSMIVAEYQPMVMERSGLEGVAVVGGAYRFFVYSTSVTACSLILYFVLANNDMDGTCM